MAAAAPAYADKVIDARTMWRYSASTYSMDQGEKLEFLNADFLSPAAHDVTSEAMGPDGKPLFASPTVDHGAQVPVVGARQLKTGSYPFICSVHPFMTATLVVSSNGTPLPPPTAVPDPAPDATAPVVRASIGPSSLRRALARRGRFTASVVSDEAVELTLRLTARARGKTVLAGRAKVAHRTPGRRAVFGVGPTRSARRALARARRAALTLTIRAVDASGNSTALTVRRTLRR
jgi:plastocyanin